MTLNQLHQIPKFSELFGDDRFKAVMQYLREHPKPKDNKSLSDATSIIRSEGAWHGWFEALEAAESLGTLPKQAQTIHRSHNYAPPPTAKTE